MSILTDSYIVAICHFAGSGAEVGADGGSNVGCCRGWLPYYFYFATDNFISFRIRLLVGGGLKVTLKFIYSWL